MGQIRVEKNLEDIKGMCLINPTVHGDSRGWGDNKYYDMDQVIAAALKASNIALGR